MSLQDILKPKSEDEIKKTVDMILEGTSTLVDFIKDYEIMKYFHALKAYDKVAKLLNESPLDLYVIFSDEELFELLALQVADYFFTNKLRKKITFLAGPFSHALVWKGFISHLKGGTLHGNAFVISKENILSILT